MAYSCKRCGRPEKHPYHVCLRYPSKSLSVTAMGPRNVKLRRDPESIIQEYGVKKLSETADGRRVIENARAKYATELIQPSDPRFRSYYGKDLERRKADVRERTEESKRLKREAGMDQPRFNYED